MNSGQYKTGILLTGDLIYYIFFKHNTKLSYLGQWAMENDQRQQHGRSSQPRHVLVSEAYHQTRVLQQRGVGTQAFKPDGLLLKGLREGSWRLLQAGWATQR